MIISSIIMIEKTEAARINRVFLGRCFTRKMQLGKIIYIKNREAKPKTMALAGQTNPLMLPTPIHEVE